MALRDALELAREADVDLVKVAPSAKPPVCKLIDYGKYRYELARKEKEARKKQKTVKLRSSVFHLTSIPMTLILSVTQQESSLRKVTRLKYH